MKKADVKKTSSKQATSKKVGKKAAPATRSGKTAPVVSKRATDGRNVKSMAEIKKARPMTTTATNKKSASNASKVAVAIPPRIMKREPTAEEIQNKKDLAQFEVAVKQMNQGNYEKAKEIFSSLFKATSTELAQKAGVFVNVCNQRLSRPALKLKTVDDYYNHAVQMANQGNWEESIDSLNKALKLAPESDYLYYGLATTLALKNDVDGALEQLEKAIRMNSKNRYLAQNDSDFDSLGEDPRFTELLYPEKPLG